MQQHFARLRDIRDAAQSFPAPHGCESSLVQSCALQVLSKSENIEVLTVYARLFSKLFLVRCSIKGYTLCGLIRQAAGHRFGDVCVELALRRDRSQQMVLRIDAGMLVA